MSKVYARFTKSRKPVSRLITWGLNEPVSHCGLELVLDEGVLVVHSDFKGVSIIPLKEFEAGRETLYRVDTGLTVEYVLNRLSVYSTRNYDALGFIYWVLRVAGTRFFGLPPMRRNPWASPRAFLCSELIADLLGEDTTQKAWSPYDVLKLLQSRPLS